MFQLLYASLKYFALGLVVGLLTAPRPGVQSRRMLVDQGRSALKDVVPTLRSQGLSGKSRGY